MTAPSRARRHAANVEVMRLDRVHQLNAAQEWTESQGLTTNRLVGGLLILAPNGVRIVAKLGQVLTYDAATRELAVLDAAVYDKTHTAAQGVAE